MFFESKLYSKNQGQGHAPSNIKIPNLLASRLCPNKPNVLGGKQTLYGDRVVFTPCFKQEPKKQTSHFLVDQEINFVLQGAMVKAHDVRRLSTIGFGLGVDRTLHPQRFPPWALPSTDNSHPVTSPHGQFLPGHFPP